MIILGDIHGSLQNFIFESKKFKIKNVNVIQLGDFGIGFDMKNPNSIKMKQFEIADEYFKENEIMMYVVRGNHDNPRFWDGNPVFTNIQFVPDYSVLNIEGKNVLFLGGATSIDRSVRVPNLSWWADEKFKFDEARIMNYENINIVVSHSAPLFLPPSLKNSIVQEWIFKEGMQLEYELLAERDNLQRAFDHLIRKNKITHWFFGHFHQSIREEMEEVKCIGLDINEMYTL